MRTHPSGCAICGEKLIDSKGVVAEAEEDGTIPKMGTSAPGYFVRVTPGNPTMFESLEPVFADDGSKKLPPDTCFDLIDDRPMIGVSDVLASAKSGISDET